MPYLGQQEIRDRALTFSKEWDNNLMTNDGRRIRYFQQNLPSYLHRAGMSLLLYCCYLYLFGVIIFII
jgi:hypothetical protein